MKEVIEPLFQECRGRVLSDEAAKTKSLDCDLLSAIEAAVETALRIASSPAHLHVVYVLPKLSAADPGVIWNQIDDEGRRTHATQAMRERLSEKRHEQIQVAIEIGEPAHRIAEFAKRKRTDLIVIPSHGRTGLAHIMIGSVAERVVRYSHCPVLVLRK